MTRLKILPALLGLMLLFGACAKPAPQVTFEAVIETVTEGAVLVNAKAGSGFDKAKVQVANETKLEDERGAALTLDQFKAGDGVKVVFDGAVRESYPVQITAKSITRMAAAQSSGSGSATPQGGYQTLLPEQAKQQLDEDKNILLVDVRTPEEYNEKHIANSHLLPVDDIPTKAAEALPDKQAKIFVYCRTGRRSKDAALKLLEMGYTNVYDIGGIVDWPYETVSGKI